MRWNKWLLAASCAALVLAGCAAEPKRPAGKSKPVATASKPASKSKTAKSTTAKKPAAKAAAPKVAKPVAAPRTPKERYAEALALIKASRWSEAETMLAAYAREFPKYSGPHTNLGIVYARTNRKPEAAAAFAKAISANSKNAVAHTWLGILARESGDLKQAEMSYRRALAANPNYAAAYLNLGILYDQYLKKPREALTAYRRYGELAGAGDLRAAVWVAELENQLKPATRTQ